MSAVQDIIGNIRSKVRSTRDNMKMGNMGSGGMIRKARTRADRLTSRIKERKPNVKSMVKEWKPGSRVKEVVGSGSKGLRGAVTDKMSSSPRSMSVSGVPAEKVDSSTDTTRGLSVIVD